MSICGEAITLVKKYEGLHLTAYRCPAGVLTIGYGHTGKDVKNGMVITKTQADELLKKDLESFEKTVRSLNVNNRWNENQVGALTSFAFNCGNGNLKRLIKNRDNTQIVEHITAYNKCNGKVLLGLTRRRTSEKELFLKSEKSTYAPIPTKKYNSIIDALKSIGFDSSYTNRKIIANKNGIASYSGKSSENITLLAKLYAGKLVI